MTGTQPRVAALVVTFNRKRLVAECLRALLAQTYQLARILLVDNGSLDGTREHLEELGLLDSSLIDYARVDVNAGASNGFFVGFERAYRDGYDWLWVMDDDAEPKPDALERLARHFEHPEPCSALACLVVDPAGAMVRYHSGRFNFGSPFAPLITPVEPSGSEPYLEIDHAAFVGLCVSRGAMARAGLPEHRFFIHLDDLEYCERLRHHGKILLIPDSVIVHKEAAKEDRYVERRFGFLRAQRVKYERLWMQYFIRRNSVYFMSRHTRSRLRFWLWLAVMLARSSMSILLFDDRKRRRLRFVFGAIADGLRGTFDNDRPKRLLYR